MQGHVDYHKRQIVYVIYNLYNHEDIFLVILETKKEICVLQFIPYILQYKHS